MDKKRLTAQEQEKRDRKRGIIATIVFHVLLLLSFFIYGIEYLDPKPEEGIAINFGYDAEGMGDNVSAPTETNTPPPTPVEESVSDNAPTEEVVTQELVDAPAISEPEDKPKEKPKKPEKPKETEQPKEVVEEPKKPSNRLTQSLRNVTNTSGTGEGVTQGGGDQGDPLGDVNSRNRTGNGSGSGTSGDGLGGGGNGNYRLGNRQALTQPKPNYECPEQGRVIVKVYVDRTGTVVDAIPGENIPNGGANSTTSSQCLFQKAKDAAMKTKWQGDANAPVKQVGFIIYNFTKN